MVRRIAPPCRHLLKTDGLLISVSSRGQRTHTIIEACVLRAIPGRHRPRQLVRLIDDEHVTASPRVTRILAGTGDSSPGGLTRNHDHGFGTSPRAGLDAGQ